MYSKWSFNKEKKKRKNRLWSSLVEYNARQQHSVARGKNSIDLELVLYSPFFFNDFLLLLFSCVERQHCLDSCETAQQQQQMTFCYFFSWVAEHIRAYTQEV
jgi:hypothetical protein